jgi:hypothetical protein
MAFSVKKDKYQVKEIRLESPVAYIFENAA